MPDGDYRRGPGWHKAPRGAVLEAYAETDALARPCAPPPKGCGAAIREFCTLPDGTQRHHPCVTRCTPGGDQ